MFDIKDRPDKCPRCGGLGTIPTPDDKKHQVCPICGGLGEKKEPSKIEWEGWRRR